MSGSGGAMDGSGRPVDVLIVGAGPVGLTIAAALDHHGVGCRIIDKAPAPSDTSKALAVWCRTLELLDGLGLAETFVRTGLKLDGGSIYAHGARMVHLALASDESPYGFPLMIPQSETERLLAEHLARKGVTVERQVELVALADDGHAVSCTLRHAGGREESIAVPWVVGCDGAHSTVRHALGMEFAGHADPNDWMLADVRITGPLAADEVSIFWHDTGVLAFFPIGGDRVRVIADVGPAGDAARPDPTLAEVQATVDARGPGGLTLVDAIWLANFRINERKVSDYRKGRVLLAGDAAHIHSPAGGQGMNTGMQDAFNLAWKLALIRQGRGLAEPLLQSYSVERSAVGDQVLANAERFTTVATLRNPAAQWLRDHIAPILGSFQFFRDKIRNDLFELSIDYRHSPLSADRWPAGAGGLAAGDRMCDARLTPAGAGGPTTLFALLRGARHTLLLLPASARGEAIRQLVSMADAASRAFPDVLDPHLVLPQDAAAPQPVDTGVRAWIDADGRLYWKLPAEVPALVLVRPDGYIGFRCQPADGDALTAHLSRYLAAGR